MRRLLALLLLLASAASAQAPPDSTEHATLDDLYIDFAAPDLTAFTLIGVDAGRVSTPGTVKALAASLANGLTADGALEQGVGVEVAPALLWGGGRPADAASPLDRLSVSFASVRSGDTTRVGLGLRWLVLDGASPFAKTPDAVTLRRTIGRSLQTFVDATTAATAAERATLQDSAYAIAERLIERYGLAAAETPRADVLADSLAGALLFPEDFAVGDSLLIPTAAARRVTFEAELRMLLGDAAATALAPESAGRRVLDGDLDAFFAHYAVVRGRLESVARDVAHGDAEAAREAFRDSTWNETSLQLAAGWTARADGPEGLFDALQGEGLQAFVGGSVGAGTWFQSTLHLQARFPALRGGTDEEVRFTGGTRVLLGSASRRLSAEALYSTEPRDAGKGTRFLLGGEVRLTDGTFLELATGVNLPDAGPAGLLTLGGLRYALRPARRFDGPGR